MWYVFSFVQLTNFALVLSIGGTEDVNMNCNLAIAFYLLWNLDEIHQLYIGISGKFALRYIWIS